MAQVESSAGGASATTQWISSKHDLLMDSLTKFFKVQENIRAMLPIVQGKSPISLRILDWFVTNYCKKRNIVLDVTNEAGETRRLMIYLDYKSQLKAYSKKQFDPFCRRERIRFVYQKSQELITTVGQLNFFRWLISNQILDYIQENIDEIEEDMNASIRSHQKRWTQFPTYHSEGWTEEGGATESQESSLNDDEPRIIPILHKQDVEARVALSSTRNVAQQQEGERSVEEESDEFNRRKRHELSISATKTVNKHNVKILVEFT